MPQDYMEQSFGFVYGRSGTSRGTTTSSGIFKIGTGFSKRVVAIQAQDALSRFSIAAEASSQTQATYIVARQQSVNPAEPTVARVRCFQHTASGMTNATAITGVTLNWQAFGY